jgi:maltooligosyltrehalose trehalohydrolase
MIFQGEEWAASTPFLYFADHDDPELARLVSEGRKKEFAAFGWDPSSIPDPEKKETFLQSKLKWDEANSGEHAEMLRWYRDLIALRKSTPALNDSAPGKTAVKFSEDERWLAVQRGNVEILCNLGAAPQKFTLAEQARIALSSCNELWRGETFVELPPNTLAIVMKPAS